MENAGKNLWVENSSKNFITALTWPEVINMKDQEIRQLREELEENKRVIADLWDDVHNWKKQAEKLKQLEERKSADQDLPQGGADPVNRPAHYTAGGVETITFVRAKLTPEEFRGFCKGNVLKYVAREAHKGGDEDLRKAAKYLEFVVGGGQRQSSESDEEASMICQKCRVSYWDNPGRCACEKEGGLG